MISYREFFKSDLPSVLLRVVEEEDINLVKEYFSYEHFYVLYCRFWGLNQGERDTYVEKEEFIKYDSHSLLPAVVDRIYEGVPRAFSSKDRGKMLFEDFIWFMISEEDKTSPASITYWFKMLDLDGNGIVT